MLANRTEVSETEDCPMAKLNKTQAFIALRNRYMRVIQKYQYTIMKYQNKLKENQSLDKHLKSISIHLVQKERSVITTLSLPHSPLLKTASTS